MLFTYEDLIDQLNRLYKYSGAIFEAALFADASLSQLATVDTTTNQFTSDGHGLINGCRVVFTTTGTLPAPLTGAEVFVINATTGTFQVSLTKNGTVVDIQNSGSGTLTVTEQSPSQVDDYVIWSRLEVDYHGSSRQVLDFSTLTPQINLTSNRAEFPPINITFKPTVASITYRYFGVVSNNLLKIEDYITTQTIPQNFPLGFSYQAVLRLSP